MPVIDWMIEGADGQPIYGNTHTPHADAVGVLVICHGFKGYKDYGFFDYLAQTGADRGLIAHRFNFSHSGMTNTMDTFERPDLFERDTWTKQIHDLRAVTSAIADGQLAGQGLPVAWFGHSRGGMTVILTAALMFKEQDPNAPGAIIPVSTPHATPAMDEQTRRLIHTQGFLESPSSRTGQMLHIGLAWLEQIEQEPEAFDPVAAMMNVDCPTMLIHGDADATVSVDSAAILARACVDARIEIINGASHTFNCPNPLPPDTLPPPETQRMVQLVCDFAVETAQNEV